MALGMLTIHVTNTNCKKQQGHFKSVQQALFETLLFIPGTAFVLGIPGFIAARWHDACRNLAVYP